MAQKRTLSMAAGVAGKDAATRRIFVENIIAAIGDGVMVIDESGSIILVNSALCEMLGYSEDELLGSGWGQLFLENRDNLDFSQTVIEVIQTRQVHQNSQVSYTAPDGAKRELISTTSLIRTPDNETLGVVAIFKDITELQRYSLREQNLLKRSRHLYEERRYGLDRVARAVSHEVRNPVMAIGGLASRLKNILASDRKAQGYLDRILEASVKLESMVSEVQKYSHVPKPRLIEVNLRDWLGDILKEYGERAADQGVEIDFQAEGCRLSEVPMDPSLMNRALHYILDNSFDAMPKGGRLTVSLSGQEPEYTIEISDTGRGMDQDDLPFVFDPFFTTKAESVGMSLAIARRIISEHEGALAMESEKGVGTTLRITLPAYALPEEPDARPPSPR